MSSLGFHTPHTFLESLWFVEYGLLITVSALFIILAVIPTPPHPTHSLARESVSPQVELVIVLNLCFLYETILSSPRHRVKPILAN